jgi:hypothetical protein
MQLPTRLRPALIHLGGTLLISGLGTLALMHRWYPSPYDAITGGLGLFALLITVDVVLGPLLTLVAASPGKAARVLARDLAVILLVQVAAMAYGRYTLAIARPVGLVFEIDQFRVISAADIEPVLLADAPPSLRELSWTGPRTFAAVKPDDPQKLVAAIQLGMAGVDLAMLPEHWRDYASQQAAAWRVARPAEALLRGRDVAAAGVTALATAAGVPPESLRTLPLRSRRSVDEWVTVLAPPDARVLGVVRVDR